MSEDSPEEGMGVSSERVGDTGSGREGTDGERDTREPGTSGAPEVQPDSPIPPRAGYSSEDSRSKDHPFHG